MSTLAEQRPKKFFFLYKYIYIGCQLLVWGIMVDKYLLGNIWPLKVLHGSENENFKKLSKISKFKKNKILKRYLELCVRTGESNQCICGIENKYETQIRSVLKNFRKKFKVEKFSKKFLSPRTRPHVLPKSLKFKNKFSNLVICIL